MSDNTGDESIFTKFKNLVSYKINNAVSDPNAEKYAAERAKNKEEKEKQLAAAKINTTVDTNKSNPNQFNAKRFFNKIIKKHSIYYLKEPAWERSFDLQPTT